MCMSTVTCVCVRSEQQHFDEASSSSVVVVVVSLFLSCYIYNENNQLTVFRCFMSYRFIIEREHYIPGQGM